MKPFKGVIPMKASDIAILRERLLKEANGICPICEKPNEAPCLDHHHTKKVGGTGLVRGVICRNCNVFLGKIENNSKRYGISIHELSTVLRSCARYLDQEPLPFIHPSEKPKAPILKKSSYNKLKKVYDGRAKFPPYRTTAKGKPAQKMTVRLQKIFDFYEIKPEFY